jgi:predicted ABC-type ATPase
VAIANPERPIFWIVAGPNGSGKSTLYSGSGIEGFDGTVWIINPDQLAAKIRDVEKLDLATANIEAVERIERWLEASLFGHQTVGVETVLSTNKYRRLVDLAKRLEFDVRLIYVLLDSPDRNVERVRRRVIMGGHDVPEEKIRERYRKSLDQLPWFLDAADQAWIYDNSDEEAEEPRLIGQKDKGVIELDTDVLPDIAKAAQLTQQLGRG